MDGGLSFFRRIVGGAVHRAEVMQVEPDGVPVLNLDGVAVFGGDGLGDLGGIIHLDLHGYAFFLYC